MPPKVNGEKVLIVDDSATTRGLLRGILSGAGYNVEEFTEGQTCLDYCSAEPSGVILLDVIMPEMDGFMLCKLLRQQYSKEELPIIMITSLAGGYDVAHCLEVGANDYISKPVDKKILLSRLENQIALKESHRALRQALAIQNATGDALPEAIAVTSHDGEVVYRNATLVSYCNNRAPSTIVELFNYLFDGAVREHGASLATLISNEPDRYVDIEVRGCDTHLPSSGSYNIQIVTKPIAVEQDKQLRLWLFRDWTLVRDLELKVQQQVRLETVNRFTSGVAHNFNNIMGIIQGACDLLKRAVPPDPKTQQCLGMIVSGVESAKGFTKKLSDSVPRAGDGADPATVIQQVVNQITQNAAQGAAQQVKVTVSIDNNLPHLAISAESLKNIFSNVFLNAFDALGESGRVTVKASYSPDNSIKISVSDDGQGMDRATLDRIFEPFFSTRNLDAYNGVSTDGSGLGMWNVHTLVKLCGGDIQVESAQKEGTRVTLSLPCVDRKQASEHSSVDSQLR
jgi:signal transduction histidine kinase